MLKWFLLQFATARVIETEVNNQFCFWARHPAHCKLDDGHDRIKLKRSNMKLLSLRISGFLAIIFLLMWCATPWCSILKLYLFIKGRVLICWCSFLGNSGSAGIWWQLGLLLYAELTCPFICVITKTSLDLLGIQTKFAVGVDCFLLFSCYSQITKT